MIDLRLLLDDYDATTARLARKRVDPGLLGDVRSLGERRRQQIRAVDDCRHEMNTGSAGIGALMREGREAEARVLRESLASRKSVLESLEAELEETERVLDGMAAQIPNIPDDAVPDGLTESENRVVAVHGYDPADYEGRSWRPHWEVAGELGIMDPARASKLSGPMFYLLRSAGARLLRSLVDFGLELHSDTYEEIAPPHLVRTEVISRTAHLTKFDDQAYRLRDDDLWLLPTAEVALMGMYQGEIIPESELPKKMMAHTVCWRREAGAAGKDTRGVQRVHEFQKVELVRLCTPETGEKELAELVVDCERSIRSLGLPWRVVELCAGDLTFSASRVFDLEVYAPGVDKWLEVASVSLVTDFQARRGQIRFRRGGSATEPGRVELVHSLNGSGLATPRVWAAVIEHGQQPDGSVRVPEALVPYMGTEVIGSA